MNNTNSEFSHDLNGITCVNIFGWPRGADNAIVVEKEDLRRSNRIRIEVDVAEGEYWTFGKNNFPTLEVFCNNRQLRAERAMVVFVPPGKAELVQFVQR